MSVLACDRNGCENIMCDRYSDKYGYICHECFIELVGTGPTTDISEFMASEKKEVLSIDSEEKYNSIFRISI